MFFSLFIVGLLSGGFSPALSADYFVTPTPPPNIACPSGSPCHTLDDYAINTSQLFRDVENITLIFLDGFHMLKHNFTISNRQEIVILAQGLNNSLDTLTTSVTINSSCYVALLNVFSVTIEKLSVLKNGSSNETCLQVEGVKSFGGEQMILNNCSVLFNWLAFTKSEINISIANSLFYQSQIETYLSFLQHAPNSTLIMTISKCKLLEAGGELIANFNFRNAIISILDSIIANQDSGLTISGFEANISLVIRNSKLTHNVRSVSMLNDFNSYDNFVDVTFINTTFEDNEDTTVIGLRNENVVEYQPLTLTMKVDNCTFRNNAQGLDIYAFEVQLTLSNTTFRSQGYSKHLTRERSVGSALRVLIYQLDTSSEVIISNSTFQDNQCRSLDDGVVVIVNCKNMMLEGTNRFLDNFGTPVQVLSGDLSILSGETTFKGNKGNKGGAISLSTSSHIYLHNGVSVNFDSNHAYDRGGAMYMNTLLLNHKRCFYQLKDLYFAQTPNIKLFFVNNSAANGGDDIYGAGLQTNCLVVPLPIIESVVVYKEVFKFDQTNNSQLSVVASDPTRVCLCNETGQPQCIVEAYIFTAVQVFPGEEFTLSAVAVGQDFGTVSSSVYAGFLPLNSTSPLLGVNQDSQSVLYTQCNTLTYTVFSKPSTEEVLVLTATTKRVQDYGDRESVQDYIQQFFNIPETLQKQLVYVNVTKLFNSNIPDALLTQLVYVNVTIQQCPLGFKLSDDPPYKCICHNKLVENGINNCTIANHTGKVYRMGNVWVSASFRGNESYDIVVDRYCPYNYCRDENIPIDLQYPDIQCAFNHSGVLCGGCPDNLSLAIGSSACLYCPNNNYLSLLIVFALAGFLLVLFIKVFDLTVSKGTISGLIFYANIVWANRAILFPQNASHSYPGLEFLRVFVAWLNLDWGIETCFSQRLNGYEKVWLQFVFPLYIWLLAGLIILLCRYSTTATRLFGNNSISVLATLFLISYAKLLRTIITALGFSVLQYSEGPHTVWSFDGNVDYFSPAHSILFIASLITLIFLWIPYTLLFLLIQVLRKVDHYRILHWTVKYKPYFDTYTGPFKDKHHYWVGLLLLVRVLLLSIVAITTTIAPTFNLVAIVVSSALLLFHPYVYRKLYLTILESSFFLNLAITAAGILYVDKVNKSQVIYPSVGIAFLQFIMIVGCHLYVLVRPCCFKNRKDTYDSLNTPTTNQSEQKNREQKRYNYYNRLREPILESVD